MKKKKGARGWGPGVQGILAPRVLQGPAGGAWNRGLEKSGLERKDSGHRSRLSGKDRAGQLGMLAGRRGRGAWSPPPPPTPPSPGWRSLSGSNRRGGRSGQSQRRQSPGRDSQQLWSGPQICSCLLPGRPARPAPPAPRPSASRPRGDTEARREATSPAAPSPAEAARDGWGGPRPLPTSLDLTICGSGSNHFHHSWAPLYSPQFWGLNRSPCLKLHAEKVKLRFEIQRAVRLSVRGGW